MNDAVREWIAKAEGDFQAAGELAASRQPNHDAICFHAQQCVEKLMKAILAYVEIAPPHTHDLLKLHKLVRSAVPSWNCERKELRFLTRGSVAFRYPGESATSTHSTAALSICTRLREMLLMLIKDQPGRYL